jgi:hypothetical protein
MYFKFKNLSKFKIIYLYFLIQNIGLKTEYPRTNNTLESANKQLKDNAKRIKR